MVGDEVIGHHYVAVGLHYVFSFGTGHGAIPDFGKPESVVFLPYVQSRDGKASGETLYRLPCLFCGAVVGYDDFNRQHALAAHAFETGFKCIGTVVGGDDK